MPADDLRRGQNLRNTEQNWGWQEPINAYHTH
jgi:hypothetical protein